MPVNLQLPSDLLALVALHRARIASELHGAFTPAHHVHVVLGTLDALERRIARALRGESPRLPRVIATLPSRPIVEVGFVSAPRERLEAAFGPPSRQTSMPGRLGWVLAFDGDDLAFLHFPDDSPHPRPRLVVHGLSRLSLLEARVAVHLACAAPASGGDD